MSEHRVGLADGTYTLSGSIPIGVDVRVEDGQPVEVTSVRAFDSEFEWDEPEEGRAILHDAAYEPIDNDAAAVALQKATDAASFSWPAWRWT